jgi:exonuclease III
MPLRILSYNILAGGADRLPLISNVIRQQQADVVALMEARNRKNVEALAKQLGMSLTFYLATLRERGDDRLEPQFPRQVIPLLLEAGYVDCYRALHPTTPGYTSHTTHPALRVDYIFAAPVFAKRLYACDLVTGAEAERASDHFPLWAEFR